MLPGDFLSTLLWAGLRAKIMIAISELPHFAPSSSILQFSQRTIPFQNSFPTDSVRFTVLLAMQTILAFLSRAFGKPCVARITHAFPSHVQFHRWDSRRNNITL